MISGGAQTKTPVPTKQHVGAEQTKSMSGAKIPLIKSLRQYSTMGAEINQKPNIQHSAEQHFFWPVEKRAHVD
jgi:hypothetical protein